MELRIKSMLGNLQLLTKWNVSIFFKISIKKTGEGKRIPTLLLSDWQKFNHMITPIADGNMGEKVPIIHN